MHQDGLRLLILCKLADGRLPLNSIPGVWGRSGNGEICDACEIIVTKDELAVEGISLAGGKRPLQLHVRCFWIWESERRPQLAFHELTTAPVIASGPRRGAPPSLIRNQMNGP